MYNVMKYQIVIIIIIIIIIIGLISYNNNNFEKFINDNKDKVTDICNAREKLDLEVCNNKNIKGDPGERGHKGRAGDPGLVGDKGDKGDNGMNGKHAYCIGSFVFKDDSGNVIDSSNGNCDETYNNLVDKETIVRIPDGERGFNARMNPIIFVDASKFVNIDFESPDIQNMDFLQTIDDDDIISKQHVENNDLPPIIIPIEKGDKGDVGKHAIQIAPTDNTNYEDNVICNTPGDKGPDGTVGPRGDDGLDNTNNGTKGPRGYTGQIIKEPQFDTLDTKILHLINNDNDRSVFSDLCSYITKEKIKKINEIIRLELEHNENSEREIDRQSSFSQSVSGTEQERECTIYQ